MSSHPRFKSTPRPVRTTTRLLDASLIHPHPQPAAGHDAFRSTAGRAENNPPAVEAMLDAIAASAEPAVAFTSLAATAVPAFADECRIAIVDEEQAAFRIHYPRVLASVAPRAGQVVVSRVAAEGYGGEPAYWATVTFVWHGVTDVDHADVLFARRLTDGVVDLVRLERLASAGHDDDVKVTEPTGSG